MKAQMIRLTTLATTLPLAGASAQSTRPRHRFILCCALLLGLSALRAGAADLSSNLKQCIPQAAASKRRFVWEVARRAAGYTAVELSR